MTATYRPIRCPHGTALLAGTIPATYEDGCRATSGAPVRFWCGPDEMSKPNGVSITAGEYLRDWDDALEMHGVPEVADEIPHPAWMERAHAEALILNEGDELYDEAENIDYHRTVEANDHAEYQRFMDENPPKCTFRGLVSQRRCTLPLDHDGVHSVWGDPYQAAVAAQHAMGDYDMDPWTKQAVDEHAEYLGEVPWSDRVDD